MPIFYLSFRQNRQSVFLGESLNFTISPCYLLYFLHNVYVLMYTFYSKQPLFFLLLQNRLYCIFILIVFIFYHFSICLLIDGVLALYLFYRYISSTITYNTPSIQRIVFSLFQNITIWNFTLSSAAGCFHDYYTNHLYEIHTFL